MYSVQEHSSVILSMQDLNKTLTLTMSAVIHHCIHISVSHTIATVSYMLPILFLYFNELILNGRNMLLDLERPPSQSSKDIFLCKIPFSVEAQQVTS